MANDIIDMDARGESLMNIGWISYLLHLVVAIGAVLPGTQASVGLLLIAFILDLVKKGDAAGSWQASHFEWRISTVIWAGVAYIVTLPLWLLFLVPGWIAWGIISIWFLYRIVKGMVRMSERRAVA
jgi:uncharacterized membrane protein